MRRDPPWLYDKVAAAAQFFLESEALSYVWREKIFFTYFGRVSRRISSHLALKCLKWLATNYRFIDLSSTPHTAHRTPNRSLPAVSVPNLLVRLPTRIRVTLIRYRPCSTYMHMYESSSLLLWSTYLPVPWHACSVAHRLLTPCASFCRSDYE